MKSSICFCLQSCASCLIVIGWERRWSSGFKKKWDLTTWPPQWTTSWERTFRSDLLPSLLSFQCVLIMWTSQQRATSAHNETTIYQLQYLLDVLQYMTAMVEDDEHLVNVLQMYDEGDSQLDSTEFLSFLKHNETALNLTYSNTLETNLLLRWELRISF